MAGRASSSTALPLRSTTMGERWGAPGPAPTGGGELGAASAPTTSSSQEQLVTACWSESVPGHHRRGGRGAHARPAGAG